MTEYENHRALLNLFKSQMEKEPPEFGVREEIEEWIEDITNAEYHYYKEYGRGLK